MDNNNGGQTLSPEERQRRTAAAIARKKVEAAYDWQKYHSAWQDYYQKYYSDYYAKAARELVEENQRQANEKIQQIQGSSMVADGRYSEAGLPTSVEGTTGAIISSGPTNAEQQEEVEQSLSKDLKETIRRKASESFHISKKRRKWIPLMAGVGVALLILFLQYNRMIFAPIMAYVSPGNTTDTGIQALDPTVTEAPGPESKLIIPKLNVDVPVAFGISNDSATVMSAMNSGVAHFMIPGASAYPGEIGNLVITGHSAGDIYSSNQYKFIFSGLERLENGDLIYVNYNSVRYTYSVVGKEVVEPTDVGALVYETNKPMLTLITCTPLGTSRYRLLVSAEQINPSTGTEAKEHEPTNEVTEVSMPANEDSFFEGIWKWLTGQS